MDNIIRFPTRAVRDWAVLERAIRDALSETDLSEAARNRVTERMKEFWSLVDLTLDFNVPVEFPGSLSRDQAIALSSAIATKISEAAAERLQAATQKLFVERIYVEIELCLALGI